MRNEQVALSPGQGWTVRGTVHLFMVEGPLRFRRTPPPPFGRSPSPGNPGEDLEENRRRLNRPTLASARG